MMKTCLWRFYSDAAQEIGSKTQSDTSELRGVNHAQLHSSCVTIDQGCFNGLNLENIEIGCAAKDARGVRGLCCLDTLRTSSLGGALCMPGSEPKRFQVLWALAPEVLFVMQPYRPRSHG